MNERELRSLKELNCNFLSGFAFKSLDYADTGIPIIKIGNIQNKRVSTDDSKSFFPEALVDSKIEDYYLIDGDVLIAMTGQGSVGRVGKLILRGPQKALLNQRVGRFICDEVNLNREFLFYILTTDLYQGFLFNTGTGSGQPNLSPDLILDTEIPYFPYEEQEAITAVLASLDDKIDLLHRQNKTLESLAQTIFRHWFVEEPKDEWGEMPLDEIADYLNGLAWKKYLPENDVDKLPVLKIRELRDGITDKSDWASTSVPAEYIVENGDVIFSWSGSLLVKIWDGGKCILNQHLFKVTSEKFPKWFFYLWTIFHLEKFNAIAESKATTMGHIKRGDLSNSMAMVPSDQELDKMDQIVSPLIEKIILNNRQITNLSALRDTLLPKLMSGEVRVRQN